MSLTNSSQSGKTHHRVKRWNMRVEKWLLGLRTWQFLLVWDIAAVAVVMIGVMLSSLIWGFNLSAVLGSACGSVLAASVMAFASRDRMQIRAEQGSGASGKRHASN